MIKTKAPKDGTPAEFVAEFEKRHGRPYDCPMTAIINTMKEMLVEPAPNPFTPDQLAWMRVEQETRGIAYASAEADGTIVLFPDEPSKSVANGKWFSKRGYSDIRHKTLTFLSKYLSWDDPEPLCFADYAPLEGADE